MQSQLGQGHFFTVYPLKTACRCVTWALINAVLLSGQKLEVGGSLMNQLQSVS